MAKNVVPPDEAIALPVWPWFSADLYLDVRHPAWVYHEQIGAIRFRRGCPDEARPAAPGPGRVFVAPECRDVLAALDAAIVQTLMECSAP